MDMMMKGMWRKQKKGDAKVNRRYDDRNAVLAIIKSH